MMQRQYGFKINREKIKVVMFDRENGEKNRTKECLPKMGKWMEKF